MDSNNTPTILINNRRGGIAEDNALMREWDCAYMQNLDGRTEPTVLKLNTKVTQSATTQDWLAITIMDGYIWCDNGKVFVFWGGLQRTIPWSVTLLSVSRVIVKDATYWSIYFWLYQTWSQVKAFCVPILPNWTAVWWSAVTWYGDYYDYFTQTSQPFAITTNRTNAYIVNYEQDFLYFAVGNKVFCINGAFLTPTSARIELYLQFESNVAWLTLSWYLVNIYLYNWMKYFWQGIQNRTTTWSIDLWMKRISSVTGAGNYDYVVGIWFTWQTNALFISQGQSIQLLKEWSFIFDGTNELDKFYFDRFSTLWNKSRASHNHNLSFFPTYAYQWVWVVSFWSRNEIVDKAWINEYITGDFDELWALSFWWDANDTPTLYMWLRDSGTNQWYVYSMGFRKNATPQYQWEWVRYTKKYVQPRTQQSTITRFRFRYDCPATCEIEVSYAINGSSNYTVLWVLPEMELDFEWINLDRRTDPRYEIQFRIKMTSSLDTTTPKLYTMECYDSNTSR